MTSRFKSALALLAALGLSACGKAGPYTFEIAPTQAFEVAAGDTVVAFDPAKKMEGIATYQFFGKKLQLEVGGQKITFGGAKIDKSKAEMISSPADSGVRTTGGELLGISTKRTLVCNPECETIQRDIRDEYCTYFENVPEVVCTGGSYDHHHGGGGVNCYTRWYQRPRTGRQTVERTTTTRNYELTGSIFGATLGEMAKTSATYTTVDTDSGALTGCY